MRKIIAIALTVLFGIGGHFINRRWDRAVLFFSLFVLWIICAVAGLFFLSMKSMVDGSTINLLQFYEKVYLYIGFGTLILWLASVTVTIFDSRSIKKAFSKSWTFSGIIGSICMSLMICAALVGMLMVTINLRPIEFDEPRLIKSKETADTNFQHDIQFGGYDWKKKSYSELPAGDAYIVGKFLFDDLPAGGIKMKLWFNGKYETDFLTTDEDGKFILRLPDGSWYLNRLETYSWKNKSTNDPVLIVSGQEEKLRGNDYNRTNWLRKKGYAIDATNTLRDESVTLKINREIILLWPSGQNKKLSASIQKSSIKWKPYKGATDYLVKVSEVKREGSITSYHPLAAKRVTNASELALTKFKTISGNSEDKEYLVTVYAFDSDGTFLSESSSSFYKNPTFMLTDGNVILEELYASHYSDEYTAEEIKELSDNKYRLTAVQVLIKDKLHKEAEALLARVQGNSPPGRKEAVAGYLAAMKGNCEEAAKFFSLAEAKNPEVCIPKFYRVNCE